MGKVKKLQRWTELYDTSTKRYRAEMNDNGDWCKSSDVTFLEVSHAEFVAAAKAVIERWNRCSILKGSGLLDKYDDEFMDLDIDRLQQAINQFEESV